MLSQQDSISASLSTSVYAPLSASCMLHSVALLRLPADLTAGSLMSPW